MTAATQRQLEMDARTIGSNLLKHKKPLAFQLPKESKLDANDLPFTRQFYDLGDLKPLADEAQKTQPSLWEQNGKLFSVLLAAFAIVGIIWTASGSYFEMKSDIKSLTNEVTALKLQISAEQQRKERERDAEIERRIEKVAKDAEVRGYKLGQDDSKAGHK